MISKLHKIIAIVFMTIGIITIIVGCMHKVGLCAGSSTVGSLNNTFPLRVGAGYGRNFDFDDTDVQIIKQRIESENDSDLPSVDIILLDEVHPSNLIKVRCYTNPSITFNPDSSAFLSDSSAGISYQNGTNWHGYYYAYYYTETDTIDYIGYATGDTSVNNSIWFESSPSGGIQFKMDSNLFAYPLWISSDNEYFTMTYSDSISGHTKGGVLTNFIDSSDLIEDSSEVPKVDTTAPSDPSSVPSWLGKILNGVGKLNTSIQSGVLTIGDYIGQLKDSIINKLDEIQSAISDFFEDLIGTLERFFSESEQDIADAWQEGFEDSDLYDIVGIGNTIKTSIVEPIVNADAPESLAFTINMIPIGIPNLRTGQVEYVYLFGRTVTLDFNWYVRPVFTNSRSGGNSVRDMIIPVISVFLYVGLIVSVLLKLPSILGGASGFSQTLHRVVGNNGNFAPTSHGIFTTGVSHNMPSLDRTPLSGSSKADYYFNSHISRF